MSKNIASRRAAMSQCYQLYLFLVLFCLFFCCFICTTQPTLSYNMIENKFCISRHFTPWLVNNNWYPWFELSGAARALLLLWIGILTTTTWGKSRHNITNTSVAQFLHSFWEENKVLPRPHFGKSDHISVVLLPASRQKLKQNTSVTCNI